MNDPLEDVLDLIAKAKVQGEPDDAIFGSLGIGAISPTIALILRAGINTIASNKSYADRLRLKVLSLNPDHYEEVRRRAAAEQQQREKKPAYQAYLKQREKKEQERQQRSDENMQQFRAAMDKINVALKFYSEWTLSCGKTLGEATKADLMREAESNRKTAHGLMQNHTFYSRMADLVPDGKTVGESVSVVDAHKIREEVYVKAA